jgi:hypothetical protein
MYYWEPSAFFRSGLLLTTRINNGAEWRTCRSDCRQLLQTHGTPTTNPLLYLNILICLYHIQFCICPASFLDSSPFDTTSTSAAKATARIARGARNSSELDAHRAVSVKTSLANPLPHLDLVILLLHSTDAKPPTHLSKPNSHLPSSSLHFS